MSYTSCIHGYCHHCGAAVRGSSIWLGELIFHGACYVSWSRVYGVKP